MDINNITLQGRLTKDADLRYTKSGLATLSFAIACNRMKKVNEEKAAADFINCRIFGEKCENIQRFLTKGRQVFLTGRLQIDNYEEHGQFKSFTQVVVNHINFVWDENDKKSSNQDRPATQVQQAQSATESSQVDFDDDIPF